MARSGEMVDDHPSVSLLLALQDNTELPVWPGSHRHLPSHSGGRMRCFIERVTLGLNARDCLVLLQDQVNAVAASTGLSSLWH